MARDVTRRIPNSILLAVVNKPDISQVEKSKLGSIIGSACSTKQFNTIQFTMSYIFRLLVILYKGKGKAHPRTGHKVPQRE